MEKKTQIFTNKPVYLGRSILEIRKIVMYIFWYDYVKPKYVEKVKLFYMETDLVYRHKLYSLHENRRYLRKHCKMC